MKRLPLLSSFILFLLLCMSLAYWGMRFYKPAVREVAAPVVVATFDPVAGQWGGIFGTGQTRNTPSEYQLKGVLMAGSGMGATGSGAIFSINGGPARSVRIGRELSPGVVLKEVHATYILVGDSVASKRVDLPPPTVTAGMSAGAPDGRSYGQPQYQQSNPQNFGQANPQILPTTPVNNAQQNPQINNQNGMPQRGGDPTAHTRQPGDYQDAMRGPPPTQQPVPTNPSTPQPQGQ